MRRRQPAGIAIAAAFVLAGAAAAGAPGGSQGGLIAFHRSSGTGVADIYVVRPDGSGPRRLTATRDNFAPAWSPDGRRVGARDRRAGSLRRERRRQRPAAADAHGESGRAVPGVVADGTLIAFERGGGVWTTNVDGTGARKIVASGSRPSFSPDGRRMLFADPNGWVAEIGADGRWRRNIVKGGVDPSWSPDGRRLVYQGRDGLYVIDADRTDRRRLTRPPRLRHDLAPAWQPAHGP